MNVWAGLFAVFLLACARTPAASPVAPKLTEAAPIYSQETPAAALHTLLAAVAAQRFDVVLLLAPAGTREGLTVAALRAFWEGPLAARRLDTLRALSVRNQEIQLEGEGAVLVYRDGEELRFVRENGLWCIVKM